MSQSVAITGMGVVCAIGQNLEAFRHSLKTGTSGISRLSGTSIPLISIDIWAEIKDFSLDAALEKSIFTSVSLVDRA